MQYFHLDAKGTAALEELRVVYGVVDLAATKRRALAIATVAAKRADGEGNIRILRPDGREAILPQRF